MGVAQLGGERTRDNCFGEYNQCQHDQDRYECRRVQQSVDPTLEIADSARVEARLYGNRLVVGTMIRRPVPLMNRRANAFNSMTYAPRSPDWLYFMFHTA